MNTIKKPNAFQILDADKAYGEKEDLKNIKAGDAVKINVCGESFWCEVLEVNGNSIIGRVDNELVNSSAHNLYFNDRVEFETKNIVLKFQ